MLNSPQKFIKHKIRPGDSTTFAISNNSPIFHLMIVMNNFVRRKEEKTLNTHIRGKEKQKTIQREANSPKKNWKTLIKVFSIFSFICSHEVPLFFVLWDIYSFFSFVLNFTPLFRFPGFFPEFSPLFSFWKEK